MSSIDAAVSQAAGAQRGRAKTAHILIKMLATEAPAEPDGIRVRVSPGERFRQDKRVLRDASLHTLREEAQPRPGNLAVQRYVPPALFDTLAPQAQALGLAHAACAPLVQSSCHTDPQAHATGA